MMFSHLLRAASSGFASITACLLVGCGGGGGGGVDTTVPPANNTVSIDPQGFYSGTLTGVSAGLTDLKMAVLENNVIWLFYGAESANGYIPMGFIHSTVDSSVNTLSSTSFTEFENSGGAMSAFGDFSGSLTLAVTKGSLTGTISGGFNPITRSLSATYPSSTQYNYNTVAAISDISGAWIISGESGVTSGATQYNLSIAGNGQFTMQTGTCSYSGLIYPRPSGKNVFNLGFNGQSALNCSHSLNSSGIAITYTIPGTALRQLIIASDGYNMDLLAGVR